MTAVTPTEAIAGIPLDHSDAADYSHLQDTKYATQLVQWAGATVLYRLDRFEDRAATRAGWAAVTAGIVILAAAIYGVQL